MKYKKNKWRWIRSSQKREEGHQNKELKYLQLAKRDKDLKV